tara:strand:- start:2733 stop:3161 length:429 start_codon:yes stop_codon:yes gene_type:complete
LEGILILSSISKQAELEAKFQILTDRAEYDFNVSVEVVNGDNSYWIPTPIDEIEELDCKGIIDIGDDQSWFEKIISLVHEIGHVIFNDTSKMKEHRRILIFEESLAWHLGYDYALKNGIEIDLKEYLERVELALQLYSKELK